MMTKRLGRKFYTQPTLKVAKELLGKFLVHKVRRQIIGKIVETEAYIGPEDKASHARNGKMTERNIAEFMKGGYVYIYLVYGMYWQFNISTSKAGKPECVLIRALEPIISQESGIKNFTRHNFCSAKFGRASESGIKNLANGPGKLCRWIKLNKKHYGLDLANSKELWVEDRGEKIKPSQIVSTTRIGIDYAGEWAKKPWRFYVKGNPCVSKR